MATHLNKHIRAVTHKAFERYGFAYAEVLARWREIAGEEFAEFSAPERIRWPRMRDDARAPSRRKLGGILVIRVTDGRSVELQHESARIIERVNTYYGYEAITGIKFVNGPLPEPPAPKRQRKPLSERQERNLARAVGEIEDEQLRKALIRLGRGALSEA